MDTPIKEAPIREARSSEDTQPSDLTVEGAIATWRKSREPRDLRRWPDPLLAAGELHGVMPLPRR
jgi:hypothetical protein